MFNLRRWTLFLALAVLCIGTLQYLFLFNRHTSRALPAIVFAPASFHPAPYPEAPHGLEAEAKKGQDWWHWDTPTKFGPGDKIEEGNECNTFPKELLGKIQVVLKVGTADDLSRTKAQLASVIKCIDNVLILSDNNYTYGDSNHQAVDVLASLPVETYLRKEDYAIYEAQRNISREDLKQGHEGEKLDKYKFLSGVEYAVEQRPGMEWFIFLESDTYMFWDNVFRLLENYDHDIPYYFGSPSQGRKRPNSDETVWFANGGPGYILSHAAAHRLVDRQKNSVGVKGPRLSDEYSQEIRDDCCGDSTLGFALHDKADVSISGLWPMFNPHSLSGLPFGSGKKYWCEPVISLHKTSPEQMENLWQWEMQRNRSVRPLLYADLIEFTDLGRFMQRPDWDAADFDGYSRPDNNAAHKNLLSCEEACQEDKECYQWTWHGRHCYMAKSMRLGHHRGPHGDFEEADRAFVSGWDTDKIRRYKRSHKCGDGPHWVKPSVKRRY